MFQEKSRPFFLKETFLQIESKKLDFKEKAKPRTDTGIHETLTSGDAAASANATVNDENSQQPEESQKNNNGDQ